MKKYIVLLLVFVFIAFLTSSCMEGLSPNGSYSADVNYQNNNHGNYHRGRFYRNHRNRNDRDNYREDHTLIIR